MIGVVRGKELVCQRQIALVPEFFKQTTDDSFVIFRHVMFSSVRKAKTVLARSESCSSVVAWNRCGPGRAVRWIGRKVKPARAEKNEPRTYCPLGARWSLGVKATALGLGSGSLASKRRNFEMMVFLADVGVKVNREVLLCERSSSDWEAGGGR